MCQLSPLADDWVTKGFHMKVLRIEVSMKPDHQGGITFKPVFRSTKDKDAWVAIKRAVELLQDAEWRRHFRDVIEKAIQYMTEVRGNNQQLALGRGAEFRFLLAALDRLESHP